MPQGSPPPSTCMHAVPLCGHRLRVHSHSALSTIHVDGGCKAAATVRGTRAVYSLGQHAHKCGGLFLFKGINHFKMMYQLGLPSSQASPSAAVNRPQCGERLSVCLPPCPTMAQQWPFAPQVRPSTRKHAHATHAHINAQWRQPSSGPLRQPPNRRAAGSHSVYCHAPCRGSARSA